MSVSYTHLDVYKRQRLGGAGKHFFTILNNNNNKNNFKTNCKQHTFKHFVDDQAVFANSSSSSLQV